MLAVFIALLFSCHCIIMVLANTHYTYPMINTCTVGETIQNNCSSCYCTMDGYNKCGYRDCDTVNELKGAFSESSKFCSPNQLYIQDTLICVCNADGTWPHKSCIQTFLSLPETNVKKLNCEPNSYVEIDCNICWCSSAGGIMPDRCTKNICEDGAPRGIEMRSPISNVFSDCRLKKWYSLGPCQFCFCMNKNELICNTGHSNIKNLKIITMGAVKPQTCSPNILKELVALTSHQKLVRKGKLHVTTSTTVTTTVGPTEHTELDAEKITTITRPPRSWWKSFKSLFAYG